MKKKFILNIFFTTLILMLFPTIGVEAMFNGEDVKIDANDFVITIEEAKILNAETAKDEHHGGVILLNQLTKEYAVPFVTVDKSELLTINTVTNEGTYPLTFRIDHNQYNDEKTVTVTVVKDEASLKKNDMNILEKNTSAQFKEKIIKFVLKLGGGITLIALGAFLIIRGKKSI